MVVRHACAFDFVVDPEPDKAPSGGIDIDHVSFEIRHGDEIVGKVDQGDIFLTLHVRASEFGVLNLKLHLGDDLPAQDPQGLLLIGGELARFAIDHAKRSNFETVGRDERRTCVEPKMGIVGDEGIGIEALVSERVRHDKEFVLQNGVRAECVVTGGLFEVDADLGLEPLTVMIDQADQRDGSLADL